MKAPVKERRSKPGTSREFEEWIPPLTQVSAALFWLVILTVAGSVAAGFAFGIFADAGLYFFQ